MIGSVLGLAGNLANTVVGGATKTIGSIFKGETKNDNTQISQLATILSQLQGKTSGTIVINGQPVDIATVRQFLQDNAAVLKQMLGKFCEENGIDTDQMFQIGLDEKGQILIGGDHSQKEKIQELLREDKLFTRIFRDTKMLSDYVEEHDARLKAAS